MIKSDFIVNMTKETKGVGKIGTKPEEGQRVEIKKYLQKEIQETFFKASKN